MYKISVLRIQHTPKGDRESYIFNGGSFETFEEAKEIAESDWNRSKYIGYKITDTETKKVVKVRF